MSFLLTLIIRVLPSRSLIPKQHGKLAVVEWAKKPMEMGPSESHRLAKEEVFEIVESCGFVVNKTMEFAEVFYGLVFVKN